MYEHWSKGIGRGRPGQYKNPIINGLKQCGKCKELLPIERFGFIKGIPRSSCKPCHSKTSNIRKDKRDKERKLEAIRLMGGKCSICHQVVPPYCFDFHHPNDDKEYSPSKILKIGSFDRAMVEIRKTVLVCAHCHRGIHWRGDP